MARASLAHEEHLLGSPKAIDLWGLGVLLFVSLTSRTPIISGATGAAAAATAAVEEEDQEERKCRQIVAYADANMFGQAGGGPRRLLWQSESSCR
jgi:hypothetical protein